MLRFYFVILTSIIPILDLIIRSHYISRHPERFSEEYRYRYAVRYAHIIEKNSRIKTLTYGTENLPKEGGYVLYPNHQGKYDAVGIMVSHEKPLTFVVDRERSKTLLLNEFTSLLLGKRLDKKDIKGQVRIMTEIISEVKEGRRYIIFPEGGYDDVTSNEVQAFLPGAFKAAFKARAPIVPVALVDSYRLYTVNSIKKYTTQVHFLRPLYYEDYKDMNTGEISTLVHNMITEKIREVTA